MITTIMQNVFVPRQSSPSAAFSQLKPIGLYLLILLLGACAGQEQRQHDNKREPAAALAKEAGLATQDYRPPADYAEHRAQQHYFESSAGKIAYTDSGTGPALVLLHGVPTSSWMYRHIIPALQKNFRVVSIDLLGYGSSDKPKETGPHYLPAAQAQYVKQLLAKLDAQQYSLLMHDMGGLVAWELLRLQPQAIANFIVLNTIITKDGFNNPSMKPGFVTRQMTKAYSNSLTSVAVLQATFNNLGLGGEYELSEEECFGYVMPMREGSDPALYAFFTHLNDNLFKRLASHTEFFQNFNGNTLVLWGAKDKTLTTAQIPFLRQQLRIAEKNIHIFDAHNHFLAEEMPEEVATLVASFLTSEKSQP